MEARFEQAAHALFSLSSPFQTKKEEVWGVFTNAKVYCLNALDFADAPNHLPLHQQHSAESERNFLYSRFSKLKELLKLAISEGTACLRRCAFSSALKAFNLLQEVVDGVVPCGIAPFVNKFPFAFSLHKIRDCLFNCF